MRTPARYSAEATVSPDTKDTGFPSKLKLRGSQSFATFVMVIPNDHIKYGKLPLTVNVVEVSYALCQEPPPLTPARRFAVTSVRERPREPILGNQGRRRCVVGSASSACIISYDAVGSVTGSFAGVIGAESARRRMGRVRREPSDHAELSSTPLLRAVSRGHRGQGS